MDRVRPRLRVVSSAKILSYERIHRTNPGRITPTSPPLWDTLVLLALPAELPTAVKPVEVVATAPTPPPLAVASGNVRHHPRTGGRGYRSGGGGGWDRSLGDEADQDG